MIDKILSKIGLMRVNSVKRFVSELTYVQSKITEESAILNFGDTGTFRDGFHNEQRASSLDVLDGYIKMGAGEDIKFRHNDEPAIILYR